MDDPETQATLGTRHRTNTNNNNNNNKNKQKQLRQLKR